jgi:hypothetical protein
MVVTILSEPRSGSTNLTNWFYSNKNFTTFFEPLNPVSKWFKNYIEPSEYKYKTKHLVIKEIYYPHKNWDSIIDVSDKIIVLYRENHQEQLESFLNSVTTKNWDRQYVYKKQENSITKEKIKYFNILKSEFKEKYINKNYFTISYEELYYNNGFQKILDYLNMDELENKNFPYGEKYRINDDKRTSLI